MHLCEFKKDRCVHVESVEMPRDMVIFCLCSNESSLPEYQKEDLASS